MPRFVIARPRESGRSDPDIVARAVNDTQPPFRDCFAALAMTHFSCHGEETFFADAAISSWSQPVSRVPPFRDASLCSPQ